MKKWFLEEEGWALGSAKGGGRKVIIRRILSEKGQAMVELALVLPILLVLVMGIIDMARAYSVLQVVTNAAREGARVAIIPTATAANVTAAVNNYLAPAGQAGCVTAGAFWGVAGVAGDSTTVTVTCPFNTLTGTLIPGWSGVFNLSQIATMRHE